MAKQDNRDKAKNKEQAPNNVVQLPQRCPAEGCGEKPKRAGFCEEHYKWFKLGLVNRKGEKPKDFDRKYQAYIRKHKQAA